MSRLTELHHRISGNALCALELTAAEREELLIAYAARTTRRPYPPMSLQILAHNAREQSGVTVYLAHFADLLRFAHEYRLHWFAQQIVTAYRSRSGVGPADVGLAETETTPAQ